MPSKGGIRWKQVPGYLLGQIFGAFMGVMAAHIMFGEPLFSASQHVRAGARNCLANLLQRLGYSRSSGVAADPAPIQ